MRSITLPLALAGALGVGACAALEPARIELPAGLEGRAADTVQGIGGGTKGRFEVAGLAGRFERSASRLTLFERWQQDRAALRLAFDGTAAEGAAEAACRLRAQTVSAGIVQAPVVPAAIECEFKRADGQPAARLEVRATITTATRDERHGRLNVSAGAGGQTLEVRSLHRLEGTRLTLPHPAGYVFLHEGRAVAALELVGGQPRLWRPAEPAWNGPVLHAAMALALLWDPAAATR